MANRAAANRAMHKSIVQCGKRAERNGDYMAAGYADRYRGLERAGRKVIYGCEGEILSVADIGAPKPVDAKRSKIEAQIADCMARLEIITDDFARKITLDSLAKYEAELSRCKEA